jgi:hypothetical protein
VLTEKELDDAYLHNFYLSQEAVEGAAGGMSLDSTQTNWDAQNKKIVNVGDPTLTGDAANKTYVDTQVSNTVTGSTTAAQKWTFTGDGSTEFTFDPVISLGEDTAYAVAIDGVMQEPTASYVIDSDADTITFTSAPPTSSNIVVIARGYSVPVSSGAGTVTSVVAGNGLSGGTITSTGTVSIPTSGGTLNINSGKVGIGGDADSVYHTKLTGDVLISEEDAYTTLTVENTNTTTGGGIVLVKAPGNANIRLRDTNTTGTNDGIYQLQSGDGFFHINAINDDGSVGNGLLSLFPTGNVKLDSLPTDEQSTAGYLWNDGGVVSVSGSSGGGSTSSYSSGWATSHGVTVANGATLTFTHGLGTADLVVQAYVSGNSDGSYPQSIPSWDNFGGTGMFGGVVTDITSTTITYQLASAGYLYMTSSGLNAVTTTNGHDADSSGFVPFTSKYIKLVAIG